METEVNSETENILPAAHNEKNVSLNVDLDCSVDSANSQPMENEEPTIRDGSSQALVQHTSL